MIPRKPRSMQEHAFQTLPEVPPSGVRLALDDLLEVKLNLHADLGRCRMTVREVLDLTRGAIVQLDKLAGEMTDVYLNHQLLARGEVVVIGDRLHVRIGEILGTAEKSPEDDE